MKKRDKKAVICCKFNDGVLCDKHENCAHCGFEPYEQARRIMRLRAADERGELVKKRGKK